MPDIVFVFAIVGFVLVGAALVSGLVERLPLSFPLLFLGIGFALGPWGFAVARIDAHDPGLEAVATLTLALVLFLDAVKLEIRELGARWLTPALILGPGTGLIIALGAVGLALMLGFSWTVAFIGGAVLASTDPVVLREIVRDRRIPRSVRQVLTIEAGTNDVVVLPVVLILIGIAGSQIGTAGDWAVFLAKLLILGPAIGFAIGGGGAWLMARVDRHMAVRREYQALYGLGLVLTAYATATAVGGDGFLAAFAAGVGVIALNQTLCDCFLEYGEVTSEMTMLVAFILFGILLPDVIGQAPLVPTLLFAGATIFVLRPTVLGLVLLPTKSSWAARGFIAWFGPRGLNSLLLTLLVVYAGVPGAEMLLAVVGIVVIVSVTVHGASATPLTVWYERLVARKTLAEERESSAAGLFDSSSETERTRITVEALAESMKGEKPPMVLDVRTRSSYEHDRARIPGDVRVLPDEVTHFASGLPTDRLIVTYCT